MKKILFLAWVLVSLYLQSISALAWGNIVLNYPEQRWAESWVDLNHDGKSEQFMQINAWNLANSNGSANLIYDKDANIYSYSQDLFNISLLDIWWWVHGYPEVFMGKKPHGGSYTDWWTLLPKQVKDIHALSFSTKYHINNTSNGPLNFAAEWWIVKNPNNHSVSGDEIEFMIMFYKDHTGPAGNKVWSIQLPLQVNWVTQIETFDIYKHRGGWDFFTFIPSRNYNHEKIEIDLYQFLPSIRNHISYTIDDHYFMNWEIGSEYGSPSVNSSKFSWSLEEFDVKVNESANPQWGSQNDTSNDTSIWNNNTASNSYNQADILQYIADNEKKLSFVNISFNKASFKVFQMRFDNFLISKIKDLPPGKYNEWVSIRNGIFITLQQFEQNKISKKQLIESLKKYSNELKTVF